MGTHKKHGMQKPRKLRLLSSTKEEENGIELLTAVNRKLQKSKTRKSRNACNWMCFTVLQKCSHASMCHGHNTHKSSYTHIFLKKRGDKRQMSSHGNATTLG